MVVSFPTSTLVKTPLCPSTPMDSKHVCARPLPGGACAEGEVHVLTRPDLRRLLGFEGSKSSENNAEGAKRKACRTGTTFRSVYFVASSSCRSVTSLTPLIPRCVYFRLAAPSNAHGCWHSWLASLRVEQHRARCNLQLPQILPDQNHFQEVQHPSVSRSKS